VVQWGSGGYKEAAVANSCRDGCSEGSGCHSGGRICVVVAASEAEMAALRHWWPHPDSGGHKKGNVGHS
jgi:hypothetical protein